MDDKIFTPDWSLQENPFPQENVEDFEVSQSTRGENFSPQTIKDQGFPIKRQAVELLSTALNTRSKKILSEFQFTQTGALQIGKYENTISGDIRISPAGLIARNKSGINTIVIDGETGDAIFAGELRSGTLVSGTVVVGNNDIVMDGETQRTLYYNNNIPEILIGED